MQIENAVRAYTTKNQNSELINIVPKLRKNGGRDLQTALLLMKLFENISPELQSELGDCYYQGDGVSQDIEKALSMFKAAADKGGVRAQYDLGWYYYDCEEYLQAIEHFSFCISHKNEIDENKLSKSYACLGDSYSKVSEPKVSTAIENLAIAADRYHHGFACRRLSEIYGEPGTSFFDAAKTIKYYELGAMCGDSPSAHHLAIDYIFGNDNLNILPNGKKAEELLLQFADSGDFNILRDLGLLYKRGDENNGINKDYDKSKTYYERSWALSNNPLVASDLGYVYFCLDEFKNAEKMLLIADSAGYYEYSDFLGRIYKEGYLGDKDLAKAELYYDRAYNKKTLNNVFTCAEYAELLEERGNYQKAFDVADYGEKRFNDVWFLFIKANLVLSGKVTNKISTADAAELMEICIQYDTHVEKAHMSLGKYYLSVGEYRKAEKQYMDAFSKGISDAAVFLGRLYEKGGGTINADPSRAFDWYSKAASAGSELGKEEVACFKKGMFGGYRRIRSI